MSETQQQQQTTTSRGDQLTYVVATGYVAMDIVDFSKHERELQFMGMQQRAPSPGCEIDREIVEKERCGGCGGALQFVPYSAYLGKSEWGTPRHEYHAYGVCRACDMAFEF